jgi:tetratricopeptide (TPR) repeat protein
MMRRNFISSQSATVTAIRIFRPFMRYWQSWAARKKLKRAIPENAKIVGVPKIPSTAAAGFVFAFLFIACNAMADGTEFTNSFKSAARAEKTGDIARATAIYDATRTMVASNAGSLCVLSRHYCDLASLSDSIAVQKDLVARALDCAQKAALLAPTNATAHASIAVCYARSCAFADIKTELAYSRLFKQEAEKALALDPKQNVAYYLLGRWNYGIANVGFFSRAYVKVIYGSLPKASFAESAAYFKKACDLAPDRILYHAGLAMAYDALGEKKLELAELKTCCALKPSGPEDVDAQRDAERQLKVKSEN